MMRNVNVVGIFCDAEKIDAYIQSAKQQEKNIIVIRDEIDISNEVIESVRNATHYDKQLLLVVDSDIHLHKSGIPEFLEVNWKHK
jgi:hypothetical protein